MDTIENMTKNINRRYWLFSTGFVACGLSTAVAVGVFNLALGVACLLAELTYFCYVNMITIGDLRQRLKAAREYTERLNKIQIVSAEEKKAEEVTGGQYL